MSQMNNTQSTAADMLPGQIAKLGAKFYYKELDGKLVPLYAKDDFVTAGISVLGEDEFQPDDVRTMQELVYPPRHVKTEDLRSLADIPHQSSVTPAPSRASVTPSGRTVELRPYQPTTLGSLGVKKYCTHWLRTGECDFNQQGCLFEHVIPDGETMFGTLGFKTIPRWIRESGQALPFSTPAESPAATPAPVERPGGHPLPALPAPTAGPPNMIMGRQSYRPQAPNGGNGGNQQRYGGNQRNTVGPNSRPFPAQSFGNPRLNNTAGSHFRPNPFRPSYPRPSIPAYTPVLPPAGYLGRGDMSLPDRSRAPSPAASDYSIASANSFMQWQPTPVVGTPGLTSGGYSSTSSPTGTAQTPNGTFMPGSSAIYGQPRAPVPHIEHRKMFVGKEKGKEVKNAVNAEREEGEVSEDKGTLLDY